MPKHSKTPLTKRIVARVQIATLLAKGLTQRDIVSTVGVSERTVRNWSKKLRENPDTPLHELAIDKTRAGSPKKVSGIVQKRIVALGKDKRNRSVRKISRKLKQEGKADVGREAVRRALHASGLHPFHRTYVPKLSDKNERDRLAFARKHLRERTDFGTWLFTDEKDFDLHPRVNKKNDVVWAEDDSEVPSAKRVTHSPSTKVWGGFSASGKTSLIFYEGTVNQGKYLDIMAKMLPQAREMFGNVVWTYQHDGASAHKSRAANNWLEGHVPRYITSGPGGEWPGCSPDLNPIENLWSIMTSDVYAKDSKTVEALKRRIKNAWQRIEPETLRKLAFSMRNRLREVVANQGGNTRR